LKVELAKPDPDEDKPAPAALPGTDQKPPELKDGAKPPALLLKENAPAPKK
jgi:carboxyl-terminal processing protease